MEMSMESSDALRYIQIQVFFAFFLVKHHSMNVVRCYRQHQGYVYGMESQHVSESQFGADQFPLQFVLQSLVLRHRKPVLPVAHFTFIENRKKTTIIRQ